jgi:hypothetical protein
MAGLGGLPAFLQYQQAAQQQANQNQAAQIQLAQFQQSQAQQRQQQAAMAAAGNALPQLLASGQAGSPQQGQMPPPPQPPQPGQASQPQQAPQQAGAPLPGQGPAPGPVRPPLPPFRPMPTTPSQAQTAPQGAIPAPPVPQAAPPQQPQQGQGGPLTLQSAIKVLQDQGLSGADLMAGLQQLTPLLDAQAKQQATQAQQQFNDQLQLARLADQKDAIQERAREADQRSKDTQLGIQERAQAAGEAAKMRLLIAEMVHGGGAAIPAAEPADALNPKAAAGYSAEALKALGEDYAQRGPAALAGFGRGNLPPAARAEVVNYAAAKNAQSGGNFATNAIQYKADTAGAQVNAKQAAKVDASANALTQPEGIGDQFQGAIDALDRTGIPIANEAQMQALRLSNDPRVATYDTAKNGVVSEVAQILGRGQVTVNSMEEARKVIDGWHTSDQARAGLAQLKREAATTVKASSEEVAKSARTPKGQPGLKTAPVAGETRTIGGKTYVQQNGKWYEQ